MTRDELVAWCRRAPDRGTVKHEDFVDYVTQIERRRRVDGRWVSEQTPYMSVDGRLAMANLDHQRQEHKLIFHDPVVLTDTEEQLTLMVTVDSELYGRRHGIATSRRANGSSIEMQHPWEMAETSAVGRALAAMGYGLLPGSGMNSAEDASRDSAQAEPAPATGLNGRQRQFLLDAAASAGGLTRAQAVQHVERLCRQRFGHPLRQCTADEGRSLLQELRRPVEGEAVPAGPRLDREPGKDG